MSEVVSVTVTGFSVALQDATHPQGWWTMVPWRACGMMFQQIFRSQGVVGRGCSSLIYLSRFQVTEGVNHLEDVPHSPGLQPNLIPSRCSLNGFQMSLSLVPNTQLDAWLRQAALQPVLPRTQRSSGFLKSQAPSPAKSSPRRWQWQSSLYRRGESSLPLSIVPDS